jgi:RNA polymerase sigma factor (sigma-70 family)
VGFLGKFYAEDIEHADDKPQQALRAIGAAGNRVLEPTCARKLRLGQWRSRMSEEDGLRNTGGLSVFMTPKEFENALHALTESRYLETVAAALNPPGEPKDIAQDVLLRLSKRKAEEYSHIRDLKRYAATAVRNRCIDLVRCKQGVPPLVKLDEVEKEDQLIQPLEVSSGLVDPYHIYEQEQLRKLVLESMDILSPLEREIARLTHLEGESCGAIADRLHLSKHVVRGKRERVWSKMESFLTPLLKSDLCREIDIAGNGRGRVGGSDDPRACWIAILQGAEDSARSLQSFCLWLEVRSHTV